MRIYGRGYINTSDIQTSTANQNILNIPAGTKIYKIKFTNFQDCHIIIEWVESGQTKTSTCFLRAYEGWGINVGDMPITAIKIVENSIQYTYQGYYTYDAQLI